MSSAALVYYVWYMSGGMASALMFWRGYLPSDSWVGNALFTLLAITLGPIGLAIVVLKISKE